MQLHYRDGALRHPPRFVILRDKDTNHGEASLALRHGNR